MKKFVIDRSKWLRGEPKKGLLLRPSDGKQCCVGLYLSACGVADEALAEASEVTDVERELRPHDTRWLTKVDAELYETNDSNEIEDPEREREIAEIFRDNGVDVEFVN